MIFKENHTIYCDLEQMISFLSSRKKGKKRRKAEKTRWMMPFLPENE
ncbi:hypothetical protein [Geobacillus thermodenitrificans]|jgi:hypothetical protein|uniref:Uncharacterized protein n=1 Tax=Geobacillus thermodenitrificans TaxID=33940 RepID=A0ABY9Q9R9_GEOTD|nr:hypothetical protein [Geobacillus thermodenitrificans]WMV75273.1 hypothetical protein HSX42_13490 [Geobacillus thermodenitrificans]